MTKPIDPPIDWDLSTWKGSRRKQHQDFHAIPFSRKLEIIEEMNESAREMIESRRKRGLPYVDPYTGEHITSAVREEPPTQPSPESS
jgi:hypothetical protein